MTQEKKDAFINAILADNKPWLLITHKDCMDGNGCILACNQAADETQIARPEVYAVQYGQNLVLPNVEGKNVLIADFSFDREILIEMEQKANTLVVIDHHESAKNALEGLDFCTFDMYHSGAVMTFQLLFPHREVPMLLQYIEDRDIWNWKLPFSKEISAFLSLHSKDIGKLTELYQMNEFEFQNITFTAGASILMYQEATINKIANNKHAMVRWGKYEIPCLNTTTLLSEIGDKLSKQYPFVMMYFLTQTDLVFSFRSSDPKIDLTRLSVPRGHKHAAGRSINFTNENIDMQIFFNCLVKENNFDMGLYLLDVFTKAEKQTIDIDVYYDVFDSNDYATYDGAFKFTNAVYTFLGYMGEISYLRTQRQWYCFTNTDNGLLDVVANTYEDVIKAFEESILEQISVKYFDLKEEDYENGILDDTIWPGDGLPTGIDMDKAGTYLTGLSFMYKTYTGSIEYSTEDKIWCGKVTTINGEETNALIMYEGESLIDLHTDYKISVCDHMTLNS